MANGTMASALRRSSVNIDQRLAVAVRGDSGAPAGGREGGPAISDDTGRGSREYHDCTRQNQTIPGAVPDNAGPQGRFLKPGFWAPALHPGFNGCTPSELASIGR